MSPTVVEIVQGDITLQQVDAIVNAANSTLLGGGGVDGAIHRAAGPELVQECRSLRGCGTGEAKITRGYRLPAAWVIHTVGPVWHGGHHDEPELLARCYRNSLALAAERGLRSVAFPSISTGAYGYPIDAASRVAVHEVRRFLDVHPSAFDRIVFVCFSQSDHDVYEAALGGARGAQQ
jgi:O-acetyl-ADP-ribose deacetylase (regulator of RNase III)